MHSSHIVTFLKAALAPELTAFQTELFNDIYKKSAEEGNYWNEEELKIEMIGFLFYLANINVPKQMKVFYERPIASIVQGHSLSVTADCLIAKPLQFNEPSVPYFFLQEYKKGRGESKDPEAQMLTAMLIAQELNQNKKILFGDWITFFIKNNCTGTGGALVER